MLPFLSLLLTQDSAVQLPNIFSDNMVLQREMPVPFFGSARPGEKIRVEMNGRFAETTAKPDGTWIVKFRPMPAGGPHTVQINNTIHLKNVMVGEVWVASGQSNMEWRQDNANDYAQALEETDPNIRMFTVTKVSADTPLDNVQGKWEVSNRQTVGAFSAVGNAFAKELRKELGVPIGIIHTSWGGTPAESWTSRDALLAKPNLAHMVDNYLKVVAEYPEKRAAYDKAYAEWNRKVRIPDDGNKGFLDGWADFGTDTSTWKTVTLPNSMEVTEQQDLNGAVWYRKTLDLPESWYGSPIILELGPIDDFDDTYFNGRKVGKTDNRTQFWYAVPRQYRIAPGILRRGTNVVAVRVFDELGQGGIMGPASRMRWYPEDRPEEAITLAGEWQSKVERKIDPPSQALINSQPQAPFGPGHPWVPSGLYNGMVAPLIPYAVRGAIWYQGESNADRAFQYRELFPAMIQNWRAKWGQEKLPFYFVQLANFTARNNEPVESDWAELREAQTMALSLPNTGQAVTIDIGEANDIHPRNKREVGRRLALAALADTYKKSTVYSGPMLKTWTREGNRIRITFDPNQGLRTSDNRPPVGFAIAGADRKFVWAQATIENDSIVVWNDQITNPVAVRYGWSNNPDVNLVNGAGLPASPFRTDTWPGITANKR